MGFSSWGRKLACVCLGVVLALAPFQGLAAQWQLEILEEKNDQDQTPPDAPPHKARLGHDIGPGKGTPFNRPSLTQEELNLLPLKGCTAQSTSLCNFAWVRDRMLVLYTGCKYLSAVSLGAALGAALAAKLAACGPALAAAVRVIGEKAAGILASMIGTVVVDLTGMVSDLERWWFGKSPGEQAAELDLAGISDHFIFVTCWSGGKAYFFALGAPMILRASKRAKAGEHRIVRLKSPSFDFLRYGARIWEYDLHKRFAPVTVNRVFAYEKFLGEFTQSDKRLRYLPLKVAPSKEPQYGAPLVRDAKPLQLAALAGIGVGGLREIHLASPINKGHLCPNPDDYDLALVVNQDTVSAKAQKSPAAPGRELNVQVRLKGFHDQKEAIPVSGGKTILWLDAARAVFHGARLEGAGIDQAGVNVSHQGSAGAWLTAISASPRVKGRVDLVLPTDEGEYRLEVARVDDNGEKPEPPNPKPGRPPGFKATMNGLVITPPARWSVENCLNHNSKKVSFNLTLENTGQAPLTITGLREKATYCDGTLRDYQTERRIVIPPKTAQYYYPGNLKVFMAQKGTGYSGFYQCVLTVLGPDGTRTQETVTWQKSD